MHGERRSRPAGYPDERPMAACSTAAPPPGKGLQGWTHLLPFKAGAFARIFRIIGQANIPPTNPVLTSPSKSREPPAFHPLISS